MSVRFFSEIVTLNGPIAPSLTPATCKCQSFPRRSRIASQMSYTPSAHTLSWNESSDLNGLLLQGGVVPGHVSEPSPERTNPRTGLTPCEHNCVGEPTIWQLALVVSDHPFG